MMDLNFNFRYKDYELKACPSRLVRFDPEEPNETIDLVKWDMTDDDRPFCFSLAYFSRGSDGYSLRFVGDRPFEYIDAEDVPIVWIMLKQAQEILDRYFEEVSHRD